MNKEFEEKTQDNDLDDLEEKEENTKNIHEDEQSESYVDWYDRYVRLSADFENFRKRTQKERADLLKYGHEALMLDLIPVIDNFERAVSHSKQAKDIEAVQTGIQMIFHQLINSLEKYGIKSEKSDRQAFDPNKHEAVSHVESDDVPSNHIIEEMQKAYFLHDKLLRPALVSVSKGASSQEQTTDKDKD